MARKNTIKNLDSKLIFTSFALILIFIGLFLEKLQIIYDGSNIETYVFASFILIVGFIQLADIGLDKVFSVDKIRKLDASSIVSLIITYGSMILALLSLFGIGNLIGLFSTGFLITQAIFLLVETWKNG
jgi:hypothetical protein